MTARYFVSIIRSPTQVGLLAGPFATHQEALDLVPAVRDEAVKVDPFTHFDRFGTMAIHDDNYKPDFKGRLNARLGLDA